jgi:hypothetical protein
MCRLSSPAFVKPRRTRTPDGIDTMQFLNFPNKRVLEVEHLFADRVKGALQDLG